MREIMILLTFACSATAHWVVAMVMALYARHKVQYLALAWINGIFGVVLTVAAIFSSLIFKGSPGLMHPLMLLFLVAGIYLQSIYPLSITMPGYLQWGRMWRYASPAIGLFLSYVLLMCVQGSPIAVTTWSGFFSNFFTFDILIRLAALVLSVYYIINIFRLPRQMTHNVDVPRYLIGYCGALGFSVVYYTYVSVFYTPMLLTVFVVVFTALNLYLMFRILETMALSLSKPVIEVVEAEPQADVMEKAEREDFNEANILRFKHIEYWMQNHQEEWCDSTFGRDRLCAGVGYNRHLLLQSVRSQGYNNIHDYINRYRIERLKSLIISGEIRNMVDTMYAGFGTPITARSCFQRMEGGSLDAFMEANLRKEP